VRRTSKTSTISLNDDGTAWVELTQAKRALIDQSDIPLVAPYRWHAKKSSKGVFYAYRNRKNDRGQFQGWPMHRDIAGFDGFSTPTQVDHINRDGLDNRRSNLRVANGTIQKLNQSLRKDNTSGGNGVHLRPWGEWQARIAIAGKRVSLGHFKTYGEARQCYNAVRGLIDSILHDLVPSLDKAREEAA
jgi:hypothetical protein